MELVSRLLSQKELCLAGRVKFIINFFKMVRVEVNANAPKEHTFHEKQAKVSEVSKYSDDEEDTVLDEDDFDINESLSDRLLALKDAIPPQYRNQIVKSIQTANKNVRSVCSWGGKGLWALTSTSLLLGIPLSLCILSEQQISEMAKGLGGDASDVLTGA